MLKNSVFPIMFFIMFVIVFTTIFGEVSQASDITKRSQSNSLITSILVSSQLNTSDSAKQQLRAKLKKLSAFSANFSQSVFDSDNHLVQKSSGLLAVSKPNLLHWQVNKPNKSLIVSDGKTLWFYDPFIEQVSVYSLKGAMTNTPILLLSNVDLSVWKNYDVEKVSTNHYLIKSKNINSQVKSLTLIFDQKNSTQLNTINILDSTGQLSQINIVDVTPLTTHNIKKLFTFNVPKGVEIDDQR